jgi:hypothetical protein
VTREYLARTAQRRAASVSPELRERRREACAKYGASQKGRYFWFNRHLKRKYGIDCEDWARLFNDQDGKCAACGDRLGFDQNTHVDHCHQTGRIRGLLCHGCNVALGYVKERVEVLEKLKKYVEEKCL